jgi:DNA polymerase-3 subunit gamma/tau
VGYLVLARKWRPQSFEEVAGQDHVTRTLANAIKAGRVAHAYLFTGPRGVGKTTTARILARALNCETGPTATPCGDCDSCRSIAAGSNMDVLEIDGASNRGIEDVRELREQVRYAPSEGRYKVYIVDEVHMLTDPAFNALLKTLEEPPPHVVFVFATTSPQKIPVTILSRCQRFDFSRIPAATILERLDKIRRAEKFEIDDAALSLIARKARGSLRDAESLLDQVTSAADGPLDEAAVVALLGVGDSELFFRICDSIGRSDASSALKDMDSAFKSGLDLGEFMLGLQEHLRSLFLLSVDPGLEGVLEVASSEIPRYKEQALGFKQVELLRLMETASQAVSSMKRSDDPRFHAELALAKMAEMGTQAGLGDIIRRIEDLEKLLSGAGERAGSAVGSGKASGQGEASGSKRASGSGEVSSSGKASGSKRVSGDGTDRPGEGASRRGRAEGAQEDAAEGSKEDSGAEASAPPSVALMSACELDAGWREVVKRVTEQKTYLGSFLAVASPVEAKGGMLALGFPEECGFHRDQVSENANRRLVQTAMQDVFGEFLQLKCTTLKGAVRPLSEGTEERASTREAEVHPGGGGAPVALTDEGPGAELGGRHEWIGTPERSEADMIAVERKAGDHRALGGSETGTGAAAAAVGAAPGEDTGEDMEDVLRRVIRIFDGEIVEGPGGAARAAGLPAQR